MASQKEENTWKLSACTPAMCPTIHLPLHSSLH